MATATSMSDLQPSDIKSMMHGKRKLRIPKACYQCYRRKVKCDRTLPCSLCVKRGHPHQCTYTHPSKKPSPSSAVSVSASSPEMDTEKVSGRSSSTFASSTPKASTTHLPKTQERVMVNSQEWKLINEKLAEMSESLSTLRSKLEHVSSTTISPPTSSSSPDSDSQSASSTGGIHTHNVLGGSSVHIGSDSVLAFILERSKRSATAGGVFSDDGILPQLALEDQAATYPFMDLWSSDLMTSATGGVCAALPDDGLCRSLLRSYRDVRTTLYPVLADIDQFEREVEQLLHSRRQNAAMGVAEFGINTAFVGILFAVLASGCQLSDLPKKERMMLCQVYVACSYQCLRNGNFLSRPTIEAIQTLLILGDVLSYNMNPGVAYVTFGMAQRMALTLGLHIESASFPADQMFVRRRLWWSMAWQDSHFALSYDRPAETLAPNPQIPYDQGTGPGRRGYFETMCRVIALTLELLREETLSPGKQLRRSAIPQYKDKLDRILTDATAHLRKESCCINATLHIERLALKLRSSYLISEICRRSLKPSHCPGKKTTTTSLCGECVASLVNTLEAYVELHQIVPRGSRSWIHLHIAISSSFLLAVDEGSQTNPEVWAILEKLEAVLVDLTSADVQEAYAGYGPESTRASNQNTPYNNNSSSNNSNIATPPVHHHAFFNQTETLTDMLYDFPIVPEVAMDTDEDECMEQGAESDFLNRTLEALRKINAGFATQKARMASGATTMQAKGSCCGSRCHC